MIFIVTGSEGFIGRALCRRLERHAEVVRIDKVLGSDAALIAPMLATGKVDGVFHLAAETSVFNERLHDIERENISTFIDVATACNRHGVKLVYASSSTANGCNTTSMYGMSKYFDEQFAAAYCPSATGVRLHNVYGPGPRQGTLLYNLIHDRACTIYNGGRNLRHFTHIDDAVEGLWLAYACGMRLVNVVNPAVNTVREFVQETARYITLNPTYTDDLRPLDNFEQSVDEGIISLPLRYLSIRKGLARVFK